MINFLLKYENIFNKTIKVLGWNNDNLVYWQYFYIFFRSKYKGKKMKQRNEIQCEMREAEDPTHA